MLSCSEWVGRAKHQADSWERKSEHSNFFFKGVGGSLDEEYNLRVLDIFCIHSFQSFLPILPSRKEPPNHSVPLKNAYNFLLSPLPTFPRQHTQTHFMCSQTPHIEALLACDASGLCCCCGVSCSEFLSSMAHTHSFLICVPSMPSSLSFSCSPYCLAKRAQVSKQSQDDHVTPWATWVCLALAPGEHQRERKLIKIAC